MIKDKIYIILLICFGCTQTPTIYQGSGSSSIQKQINTLINQSGLSTNIGLKAVSMGTGELLYEMNSSSLFNPASNNKLFTNLSALALLDTNYTFYTNIYHDGNKLFLVGGGDPDLSLESLDSLALIVVQKGLKVDRLVLDDSRMDSTTYGEGWMWDEGDQWYSAHISALSINDNCIDFIVNPGELGHPASIRANPISTYYSLINNSLTVNDTTRFNRFNIERDWQNGNNIFTISGNIMDTTSTDTLFRNIEDPTRFTGGLFKEMLESKGLIIQSLEKGLLSGTAQLIASHESHSMANLLKNLMVESDNLTAELLTKTIGYESDGYQGNWINGLSQMRKFLNDSVGIDTTTFSIRDGSGVSRYNYVSPNHFIQLLEWAYNNPSIRNNFIQTLPRGGPNGTLQDRNISNQIYAKTGSLFSVTTLSGYVFTQSRDVVAFSILMNGFQGSSEPYRVLQDKIVSALEML